MEDPSPSDVQWMLRLASHSATMITTDVVERLRAHGFIENLLGGPGLSKAGLDWLIKHGHMGHSRRPR